MNGEFAVSVPGAYDAVGARFIYSRKGHLDSVYTVGPIHEPIDIMVRDNFSFCKTEEGKTVIWKPLADDSDYSRFSTLDQTLTSDTNTSLNLCPEKWIRLLEYLQDLMFLTLCQLYKQNTSVDITFMTTQGLECQSMICLVCQKKLVQRMTIIWGTML